MARKRIEDTRLLTLGSASPYKVADSGSLRGVRPPRMLVTDFLPAGMLCGLTSAPGVGKTWLAMELARAVVTVTPAIGEFKVNDGPHGVLFVGSDSSLADYARQWARLSAEEHKRWLDQCDELAEGGVAPSEFPEDPFSRIRFLIQSTFMLDSQDEVRRLIRTALDPSLFPITFRYEQVLREDGTYDTIVHEVGGGCALIVMDTVSRLTNANQNDNTEMERVFANARVICEVTGAVVLVLHHTSKPTEFNDGADFRGASSQRGAIDCWINLSAHKRTPSIVRAEFKKFRGITPPNFEYKMLVSDPDTAKLAFLGQSGGLFGTDDLREEIPKALADWKTVAALEDALWPSYSDRFSERGKFKKALRNRLGDLYPDVLQRRGTRMAHEYKVKDECQSTDSTPATTCAPGAIPTT